MDREEHRAGEVPPANGEDPDHALVADEVVATYVADAARPIAGVVELHGSTWQALSERVHMDVPSKGVLVRHEGPGVISIDVHVKVAWGTVIPVLAQTVQDAVTKKVESLLDLTVESVTLYVDEVEPPPDPANG